MRGKKDNYADDIGRKVYALTWQGKLWGREGAIAWSRSRFLYLKASGHPGDGTSALSSTYYTAAGNAFSQVSHAPLSDKFFWLFRGIWCMFRALSWSNYTQRIIGFERMTHGQLDVRGSILAKWRLYGKAEKCLHKALEKKDITDDSRALVLCKLGEVLDRKILNRIRGDDGGIEFGKAVRIQNVKNTTRVRVLKALGAHMLRKKRSRPLDYKRVAMNFLGQALEIAQSDNLGDQIIKIKALMKKAEK